MLSTARGREKKRRRKMGCLLQHRRCVSGSAQTDNLVLLADEAKPTHSSAHVALVNLADAVGQYAPGLSHVWRSRSVQDDVVVRVHGRASAGEGDLAGRVSERVATRVRRHLHHAPRKAPALRLQDFHHRPFRKVSLDPHNVRRQQRPVRRLRVQQPLLRRLRHLHPPLGVGREGEPSLALVGARGGEEEGANVLALEDVSDIIEVVTAGDDGLYAAEGRDSCR
eukprot:CAMPEP_0196732590 /NCGR_PEP_ID=MMETSP1091-20130531/11954_1 /TAXON_ID=302021 /ORGANISM="Rhodomonas sp., Strain CCMP768" /LENGTH=223 /DNA_ID=CAMNT_0042075885 /DNA_START=42 /DNA_END=710 /DNA_ORIENTATION=-